MGTNWLQTTLNWTEQRVGQASDGFREILGKIKNEPAMTVTDLATFIMLHPETHKERSDFLGLTYYTYSLHLGNVDLLLETREGNEHKVLECRVDENNQVISHYRSYDAKAKERLAIPLDIKQYHN
ncbi:hypothetical protein LCY76_05835 [Fictibacillus sp. KIGAM418]|uniref:Uncharacterized protein n=1 Tax=Fictibacillus marinisediminis TaxID=2878389 RepID=A0A9X2BEI1_9BACL|nr:hypothetical protein [Fictibacillus marinisediminis]MCK6256122.1 hypothetical protein [Fictibacillus marinisediminis]